MNKHNSKASKRSRRKNRQKGNGQAATVQQGRSAQFDQRFRTPLFPPRFRKKLVYVDNDISIASTAGLLSNYFYSANGLFDPNISGVGHQPMGFDQMMLMYNHYTVVRSKVTVNFVNMSAAGVYVDAVLWLAPDTTATTTPGFILENGYCIWQLLNPTTVVGSAKTMSLGCNVSSYFGRDNKPRELVEDVELAGTSAANPTEQVYFALGAFDHNGAAVATLTVIVTIEYDVIFWEPKKLTQS